MRHITMATLLLALIASVGLIHAQAPEATGPTPSIYDIAVKTIDGRDTTLADYKGKVLLIVNVASQCGYTPQYKGLQQLYSRHKDQGLVVLAFPANNFGAQEPGSNAEIKAFAAERFAVEFPMFAKISINGPDTHPLYVFLTDKRTNPDFPGEVTWNFSKFVVDRQGRIIARFAPDAEPEAEIAKAIESALKR